MDKLVIDPATNLLTKEYENGISQFMLMVQPQPKIIQTSKWKCTCSSCKNNKKY